eukprot:00046.XXX_1477_1142_1 [CDS] Oithona nana genome sequencing.
MKCANRLSKATMDLALDNLHEDYNHQCIFIESLDYCVQYWKQNNQVDCEEPIRDMVKQNFHIGAVGTPNRDCLSKYISGTYTSKFENSTLH